VKKIRLKQKLKNFLMFKFIYILFLTRVNFWRNPVLNKNQNYKQAKQKNLHVLNVFINSIRIIRTDAVLIIMVMSPQNE
jgi:hypothetical protein